jgi:hypothetical protein
MLPRRHALALSLAAALPPLLPRRAGAAEMAQDEDLAYAIGVRAYIWAFPMMDLYRTLWETCFDPARGHDRTLNEFFRFERLITHEDDWVITPNNDTIYDRAFMDLRAEPMVLSIPATDRQYWFPCGDMRHDFNANLSWDTVGRAGGNFAFCPPRWQGVLPAGVRRVDMATPIIWTLGRYDVAGPADLPGALALQRQVRLVPLSRWGQAEVPRPAPEAARYPRFTRQGLQDARACFTAMNEVLRMIPRFDQAPDRGMEGWLAEINVAPHQRFDWDALSAPAKRGLERATRDAHRIIAERMQRAVPIVNNWQVARLDPQISADPLFAAAAAMLGLLWNPKEVSTYDVAFLDSAGAQLTGANRYVLRLDPPPPVNAFYSVTMYDARTQLLVQNPIARYSIGDRTPGVVRGANGSMTVVIQHQAPTESAERANWLPAPAGPFYLVTRHYSPRSQIFTGDWVPRAIERR